MPRPAAFSRWSVTADQKRVCVHAGTPNVSVLNQFAKIAHRHILDCSLVYTGGESWAGWDNPWFVNTTQRGYNWADWVRNAPRSDPRTLVISQEMIPAALQKSDWLWEGAHGAYTSYARTLAANLVAAGLGHSVIRLGWEANGNWEPDSLGTTRHQYGQWVQFWRKTVFAMRSVHGAHFLFDWCVNNGYRRIPLSEYYPGNDAVDIIGDDAFDSGVPVGRDYWNNVYERPYGLGAVARFASAHHKPLSLPEWGVGNWGQSIANRGDDGQYINGIARLVRRDDVAYQSYFFGGPSERELYVGHQSLAALRRAFGAGGNATGSDAGTDVIRARHRQAARH